MIISLFTTLLLLFISSFITSSSYSLYSLLRSCESSSSTLIISGLSLGYFSIIIPILLLTGLIYLCYYWLDIVGIYMSLVGIAVLLPYVINLNLYSSVVNTTTMVAYINKY